MIRPILTIPHPALHRRTHEVRDPRSRETQSLIADLKETCVAALGMGLAAPQVGILDRVIVVHYPTNGEPDALVNPEVVWTSTATSVLEEGCLSIPNIIVPVRRPRKVRIRALSENGEPIERLAGNLLAKILQHEIDHLNGVLITDYQSSPTPAPLEA